ncbi:MAG: DUF5678 domain-containing protein [Euryarchaeota archaeon]|nr:DUF5678 domain-containing protein [Euryarchaeota archaeon]
MVEEKLEDIKLLFEINEKNEEWLNTHYKEFEQKHGSKFLAIKDQRVLAVEDKIEKLLDFLEKKGVDINQVFITSIPPKGVASIL